MSTKAITNFDHALALFAKDFDTYSYWSLHEGKEATRGGRISSCEALGSSNDVVAHTDHIKFVMSNYEPGYFVLVTRKKANDTASEQAYRFKFGEVNEFAMGGNDMFGIGSTSARGGGGNAMQMFLMQAAIKGLQGGGNSDIARLENQIAIIAMKHDHEKELEKERSNVGNRIMGLVEDNFDSIMGKLPLLNFAKGSTKPKASIPPVPTSSKKENQESTLQASSGKMMHELPLNHKPENISSDAMVHYAKEFQKLHPDINPCILFAKMVAFAANNPEQTPAIINILESQTAENHSDE